MYVCVILCLRLILKIQWYHILLHHAHTEPLSHDLEPNNTIRATTSSPGSEVQQCSGPPQPSRRDTGHCAHGRPAHLVPPPAGGRGRRRGGSAPRSVQRPREGAQRPREGSEKAPRRPRKTPKDPDPGAPIARAVAAAHDEVDVVQPVLAGSKCITLH